MFVFKLSGSPNCFKLGLPPVSYVLSDLPPRVLPRLGGCWRRPRRESSGGTREFERRSGRKREAGEACLGREIAKG